MRLKEIKPGMAIHCKNDGEKKALLEEAERFGYKWNNNCVPTDCRMVEIPEITIHFYGKNECSNFKHIAWSDKTDGVTEFSDLILPELSAEEEVLLAYDQMCKENYCCNDCPIYKIMGDECAHKMEGHISEIVDAIKQWKSSHDKKEPEIEWVYRVFGAENYREKFFQTEEEAIKRCEELAKSQKTKQYARYERVCRVKAVE